MSLATTINHYRMENNRKYHTYRKQGSLRTRLLLLIAVGDGTYWMPHDKEAVELDTIA